MRADIPLEMNLEQVVIAADFYQQARDLYEILMVDATTDPDDQIHKLASMFQSAYDQGRLHENQRVRQAITENLFRAKA